MPLRIATWNIFFGNYLSHVLKSIQSHEEFRSLDLIAVQEASIHAGIEDGQSIANVLGKTYEYYQVTSHISNKKVQANAVIWNTKKIKVTEKSSIDLPQHGVSFGKRKSLVIEGMIGEKSFRLYATHFDVLGFRQRTAQLACILEDDTKRKKVDMSCILGDLNTFAIFQLPQWTALKKLADNYGYTDITQHLPWTFQHLQMKYRQKLDSIFLRNAEIGKYVSWSKNIAGSDHIPLFADIEL